METIVEHRQVYIRDKVVGLRSIQALARFVIAQADDIPSEDREKVDLTLVARCEDGSSFQSDDISIFADDSRVWQRRVTHFSATYSFYPSKARIEISVKNGADQALIAVSGRNRIWVAGTLESLVGIFGSFPPQENFYLKHRRLMNFLVAMGIGSILMFLLSLLSVSSSEAKEPEDLRWLVDAMNRFPIIQYFFKYTLTWFLGWPWTDNITRYFSLLWPSIELQVGPDHLLIEKRRRKLYGGIFLLGVLPLSLSIVLDLLKALAGG